MGRASDLEEFYRILNKLELKFRKRLLVNCNGKMNWPRQGVYFFFEEDEVRENSDQSRVVRVGTHAISNGSSTSLWDRLRAHRGNLSGKYSGGGNHRGSIFRSHIGTALINRDGIRNNSWGKESSATSTIRAAEHFLEIKVSEKIRSMPFLWLNVNDSPGSKSVRKIIEKNSVALLSNYNRTSILDPPSTGWLGHYCANEFVRKSGLWNVDHVDENYDPAFLDVLYRFVKDI